MNKIDKQNGFTLLELVIVTVSIVILSITAYSVYQVQQNESEAASFQQQPEQISKTKYTTDQNTPIQSESTAKYGEYISYDEYQADKNGYSNVKKVLFFHASWCPVCQSIDREISADETALPAGTVLIKTDYDTNTQLRQKYGVTYQYTFVQIDNNGTELKQWTASSLKKLVAGIQ